MKGRETLIVTFCNSFEDHERLHRFYNFQPLLAKVLEMCDNGND